MKEKLKHYAKEIAIFIVIMTIFANIISFYKSTDLNKDPLTVSKFTLLNNKTYIVEKQKPILVHIWATWCPTCKVEASNIQTISQYYDVVTIAVKSGEDKDIQKWMNENNYDFKVVNDNTGLISSEFNIAAYPTTFIYDKNNELIFSEVGYTSTIGLWLRMWWSSF